MGIIVSAAVELPEFVLARDDGLASVPELSEALVGLDVLVVGPKVVGRVPGLNDGIEIERGKRSVAHPARRKMMSASRARFSPLRVANALLQY